MLIFDNSDDVPPKWMTESDKSALLRAGIKFMDITDHPNTPVTSFAAEIPGMLIYTKVLDRKLISHIAIPTKAIYQQEAEPFIGNLTTDTMETVLTHFTSFRNRYYKSKYGAESCRWLIQQIRDIASGNDHVSVKEFKHSVRLIFVTRTIAKHKLVGPILHYCSIRRLQQGP